MAREEITCKEKLTWFQGTEEWKEEETIRKVSPFLLRQSEGWQRCLLFFLSCVLCMSVMERNEIWDNKFCLSKPQIYMERRSTVFEKWSICELKEGVGVGFWVLGWECGYYTYMGCVYYVLFNCVILARGGER